MSNGTSLRIALLGLAAAATLSASQATAQSLTVELVASGVPSPVLATAPDGDLDRVFIVEQNGRIRVVRNGTLLATSFLNVASISSCCSERGLLGLAFHPDFANNGRFFINYTNNSGSTVVAEYGVSGNPLLNDVANSAAVQTIITISQPFSNHNGGMIAFGHDGMLYVGTGDGGSGNDPGNRAQNGNNLLGKMLRFDVDIPSPFIPASNPFVGNGSVRDEIWAIGLRNPWRFSFDRLTGDMWIADVGQNAREEIHFEAAGDGGNNYGWRCMEGFNCTGLSGCTCNGGALTLPVQDYSHAGGRCSITGGYVYRGAAIPSLQGEYFYADYCSSNIWSRNIATGTITDWTSALSGPIGTISGFGEDAAGNIYICNHNGSSVYVIKQDCTGVAQNYCTAAPNSVAPAGAPISASGPLELSANNWQLNSFPVPANQFGVFFYGPNQINTSFGDGVRCVGGSVVRLNPVASSDVFGFASRVVDLAAEGFTAGQTYNFQYWYRDPGGPGGTGFNLSDGLEVVFCP